jgi:hypothetical protein
VNRSLALAASFVLGISGCASLQQFAALRQVAFALDGVANGRLAGVEIGRFRNASNLSPLEIGRITVALARRDVPLDFTVNVRASNPAENATTASMVRMAWTLLLDDKETISGVIDTVVALPPGQPTMIPLRMRLNLAEFVDGPAEDLVNLALSVAGLDADPTRVTLRALPTVDTPIGPIRYPAPITIVNRNVGGTP